MSVTIEVLQLEAIQEMGRILHEDIVDAIAAKVAKACRAEWIRLAGASQLTTTKRDYINGIQQIKRESKGTYLITLVGGLPNMLEQGMDAVDLRDWLLGPKVPVQPRGKPGKHVTEDGEFYRAIPFGHAGPKSTGAGGLKPMGSAYNKSALIQDAKKLGRDVFAQAKMVVPQDSPYGKAKHKRLNNPYTIQGKGKDQRSMAVPKLDDKHSTDIYSGMIRNVTLDKRGREHSTFTTFRMISTASGLDKWHRKATPGLNLATQVSDYISRVAPVAFEEYVKSL